MFSSTSLKSMLARAALAVVLSVATLTLSIAPFAASAATASQSASVRLSDLDLAREAGVVTAYRRIENAAAQLCGSDLQTGTRFTSPAWKACVEHAVAGAVSSVDAPLLKAYHQQRSGKLPVETVMASETGR